MKSFVYLTILALLISGCSTGTYVKLPDNTELIIERGNQVPREEGYIVSRPMSWGSAAGIPYRLERDGEIVDQGKMRAKFRPASIFWPPFAIFYWPMGFRQKCYDLTSEYPSECTYEIYEELKGKRMVK